jgi:hypothetical protein
MAPSNTSNMARAKADASSTPNTPSSIKLSPLIYFSHVRPWFNIDSPRKINSPHKIEAEVRNSPKNDTPNLDTPAKKNKKKAKTNTASNTSSKVNTPSTSATSPMAQANASFPVSASTSPKSFFSFRLDNPPEGKFRAKAKAAANPNPAPIRPVHVPGTPWTCIVCSKPFLDNELQDHFEGRPHEQTKGLLKAYVDKVRPKTRLLMVNENTWRCPPCDESIPQQCKARGLQEHLASNKHEKALEKLWRNLKAFLGLRGNENPEIPDDLDNTFI